MSKSRVHLWIEGRVQGVWFRGSTKEEAERLGVSGWVRNLPDGRVEAVAEGDDDQVERFVKWCRQGPSMARVDDIRIEREEPEGASGGFRIAR